MRKSNKRDAISEDPMAQYFYIICLKYGPGHWQHMKSFASCLHNRNYNIRFILSRTFKWMNKEFTDDTSYLTASRKSFLSVLGDVIIFSVFRWFSFVRILKKYEVSAVLFALWHPLNFFVAKIIKKIHPEVKILYWMHEPYKEDKSDHKGKELAFTIIEYLQEVLLPLVDIVILHSMRAFNAFKFRYPHYKGEVRVIPLGYKDECKPESAASRAFDITFIGNAAKAKGIDAFFEIVKKNMEIGAGLALQLVTSSRIDTYLNGLQAGWEKYLKVINKPAISDDEMREACAISYSVITPYKETTQSGVIPVAFMNGTPVIGTDIEGLHEYITDKINGVYIPKNFSYSDVASALNYIKANFSEMSQNARKSFQEIWSDRNWDKYYAWLIQLLEA